MIYWAVAAFAISYILMLVFSKYRPYIALGAAVFFVISGMLSWENVFGAIDFNVLLMIAGTMGVVALFIESKMPELLADFMMKKVSNIKWAVLSMVPVIAGIAEALHIEPTVLYFGLLSGATLGGNCTPIGASANIAGIGILRKEGYTVKNSDFFKIGIPFTLAAIIPAYIYLWIMYGV